MTPEQFVKDNLPYALMVEKRKGLHHEIILTQAAAESAWGTKAVGNNFFGIKDTDGINGNEQLITTTEYLSSPNKKFPQVISVVKVAANKWKYKVKDWFRKYNTAEQSFLDHAEFFERNPRYATALLFKNNPDRFFEEIQKAGYATDPNYAKNLKEVRKSVLRRMPKK